MVFLYNLRIPTESISICENTVFLYKNSIIQKVNEINNANRIEASFDSIDASTKLKSGRMIKKVKIIIPEIFNKNLFFIFAPF